MSDLPKKAMSIEDQMTLFWRLLIFGLILLFGYIVWADCGFRDQFQTNQCRKQIEKLATTDVSTITIGHQLIDRPADINSLLTALKKNAPLSSYSEWIRGCGFTLVLNNGQKLLCSVNRYKDHPGEAILQFEKPYWIRLKVPGLANVIDTLGAHLPESGYLFVSDETGKIKDGQISFTPLGTLPPHTLYNIQRAKDPLAASNDNNKAVLIITSCLLIFGGFFGYVLGYPITLPLRRGFHLDGQQRKDIIGLSIFMIVVVAFVIYAFDAGFEFNKAAHHYKSLKTLLEEGKCKILCGKLTDVRYIVKDHGAKYLYIIEIDGHQFFFSRRNIDQDLYDAEAWKDWAPEQLQPGVQLCVWYATIDGWEEPPEQVARVDVR